MIAPGILFKGNKTMKIQYKTKKFRNNSLKLIELLNKILYDYEEHGYKLTLRQAYYQLVARDLIPNTEKSYKNIGNLVNDARLAGIIDWDVIVDRTRNVRRNSHWNRPQDVIDSAVMSFALDKWENQPEYIEVWVEKDALIDIVGQVCEPLDVPYFSCRGYTSQTAMQDAAQRMNRQKLKGKNCHIIHLGDHDPSGIDMSRDILERTNELFGAEVELRRIALTMNQVETYNLPPNPAKETDKRSKAYITKFGNESWELDALEPTVISRLITNNILSFRDDKLYQEVCQKEAAGKAELNLILNNYQLAVDYLRKN